MMRTDEEAVLHDGVGSRERLEVVPVGRMPSDVPGEEDTDLDFIVLEVAEDAFAVVVQQGERQPIILIMPRWEDVARPCLRQVLAIPRNVAPANGFETVKLLQLRQAECSVHLTRLHVVAYTSVE